MKAVVRDIEARNPKSARAKEGDPMSMATA
jgi:hypothetical protein